MEHNDFVHPVEKLRSEMVTQLLQNGPLHALEPFATERRTAILQNPMASDVRGHNHDRVLEVDSTALSVCKTPVVKDLQQDVEHVGVGFFDFVEKHHTIWTTSHGLR